MSITATLNLADPQVKNTLVQHVRTLDGLYRVEIVRNRMNASQRQHAWYRGLVLQMIADEYRAQGNEVTDADVHSRLGEMFLKVTRFNKQTGEVWGDVIRSTADLTTEEMAEFIEKVRAYAAQSMDLNIPDPDPMWRFNQVMKAKVAS